MAALSSLLVGGAIFKGATSLAAGASDAAAERQKAAYEKSVAENNAKIAEYQAGDAIARGDVEAQQQQQRARRIRGAQRVAAAGQGIDPNSGSAKLTQIETDTMGELDAMTVRNNAYREAMGYRATAIGQRAAGAFAQVAGENKARSTLLTGGMNAINSGMEAGYYAYGGKRSGKS